VGKVAMISFSTSCLLWQNTAAPGVLAQSLGPVPLPDSVCDLCCRWTAAATDLPVIHLQFLPVGGGVSLSVFQLEAVTLC